MFALLMAIVMGTAAEKPADPLLTWESNCVTLRAEKTSQAQAAQLQTLANEEGAKGWLLAGWSKDRKDLIACFTRPVGGAWPLSTPLSSRIPPNAAIDLTGAFNDTDADLMSSQLANQCIKQLETRGEDARSLAIKRMINKSDQHVDLRIVVTQLERRLVSSGTVRIVEAGKGAPELVGTVSLHSTLDQVQGKQVRFYLTTLEAIDATSGEKLCIASGKVKKYIDVPSTRR